MREGGKEGKGRRERERERESGGRVLCSKHDNTL